MNRRLMIGLVSFGMLAYCFGIPGIGSPPGGACSEMDCLSAMADAMGLHTVLTSFAASREELGARLPGLCDLLDCPEDLKQAFLSSGLHLNTMSGHFLTNRPEETLHTLSEDTMHSLALIRERLGNRESHMTADFMHTHAGSLLTPFYFQDIDIEFDAVEGLSSVLIRLMVRTSRTKESARQRILADYLEAACRLTGMELVLVPSEADDERVRIIVSAPREYWALRWRQMRDDEGVWRSVPIWYKVDMSIADGVPGVPPHYAHGLESHIETLDVPVSVQRRSREEENRGEAEAVPESVQTPAAK